MNAVYHCAAESMQSSTFLHKWNRQLWQEEDDQFMIPFPSSKRDKKGEHASTWRDQRSSCCISPRITGKPAEFLLLLLREARSSSLPDQQHAGEQPRSSPSTPASRGAAPINRREEALPQALSAQGLPPPSNLTSRWDLISA